NNKRFFNGGAPGRNVSHTTGDSGFDHEAWKVGVFIEKEWGWGRNWRGFTRLVHLNISSL
ncbi:mCG50834, partial [Mus musculus]